MRRLTNYAVDQLRIGSLIGIAGHHGVYDGSVAILRHRETITGSRAELGCVIIDIANADDQCGHIKVLCIDLLRVALRGALLAHCCGRRHGHAIGIPHIDGQHVARL